MPRVSGGQQETNMNLNITPSTIKSGTDELVPSRYALRIGEIECW